MNYLYNERVGGDYLRADWTLRWKSIRVHTSDGEHKRDLPHPVTLFNPRLSVRVRFVGCMQARGAYSCAHTPPSPDSTLGGGRNKTKNGGSRRRRWVDESKNSVFSWTTVGLESARSFRQWPLSQPWISLAVRVKLTCVWTAVIKTLPIFNDLIRIVVKFCCCCCHWRNRV